MNHYKWVRAGCLSILLLSTPSYGQQSNSQTKQELILETFPSPHERHVYSDDFKSSFPVLYSIVNFARRWDPGSTLNACFYKGTKEVNIRIAEIAADWLVGVNLRFNFIDAQNQPRDCKTADFENTSQIRIGFSCPESWALLGTEAVDPTISSPPQCAAPLQTMNLSRVQQVGVSDSVFQRDVRHEFGHVLGFYHEHMRCGDEYDRDVLYKWLEDNMSMTADQITRNFYLPIVASDRNGIQPVSSAEIDQHSIEFYSMPSFFFKKGVDSPCYVSPLPITLSPDDRKAARQTYPSDPEQIAAIQSHLISGLAAIQSQENSARLAVLLGNSLTSFTYSSGNRPVTPSGTLSTQTQLDELRAAEKQLRTRLGK